MAALSVMTFGASTGLAQTNCGIAAGPVWNQQDADAKCPAGQRRNDVLKNLFLQLSNQRIVPNLVAFHPPHNYLRPFGGNGE